MRLDKLWIDGFRNLNDFEIDFDEDREISVLLGRNGSAKSNVIEALVRIFSGLKLDAAKDLPTFKFKVRYLIHGRPVDIDYDPTRKVKLNVDGEEMSLARLRESEPSYLPSKVVLYYSGESRRYDALSRRWDAEAHASYDDPTKQVSLRDVIKADPMHAKFAALACFAKPDRTLKAFMRKTLLIESFDSALVVAVRPSWTKREDKNSEFWGAKGASATLLERIRRCALAPITSDETIEHDFDNKATEQLKFFYLPSAAALQKVAKDYGDPAKFFQTLDTIRLSRLVHDVRIRVRMKGQASSILSRDLSEGELQLLAVLSLMRFTRDQESLYLLDEPDTHLNPAWGLQYLSFLRDIGEVDKNSHTIIATHDPMLVAGLVKEEIRILLRNEETGRIVVTTPTEDPKGKGVAATLTSEFGLASQLDPETETLLNKRRQLAAKKSLTAGELRKLDILNTKLRNLGYIEAFSDPIRNDIEAALYRKYESENLVGRTLTPEEVERRRQLALDLIKEMNFQ